MNPNDYEYVTKNIWTPFSILNGRVNLYDVPENKFKVSNNLPVLQNEKNLNTISRTYTETDISIQYFSRENIEILHDNIIKKVYYDSDGKYKIRRQSDQELNIIMRSIYLQFGQNRKTNIKQQLIDLNKRVIDWCVKEIISNIMQYDSYKETISTLPMPLERSQLPSQKGTRVLEIKSFI